MTENKSWGGKRAGAGRPVGTKGPNKAPEDKKDKRIVLVCTEEQNNKIKSMAKAQGLTVSAFILKSILGDR